MQPRPTNERSLNLVVSAYVGLTTVAWCGENAIASSAPWLFAAIISTLMTFVPEVSDNPVRNTVIAAVLPVVASASVESAVTGAAVSAGTYLLLKKTGMFPAYQREPAGGVPAPVLGN